MQQRMKAKGYQQNVAIVAPTAASFYKLNMGKLARQYLINVLTGHQDLQTI
jgi:hypothetical protein